MACRFRLSVEARERASSRRSPSPNVERPGFERLVAMVCSGDGAANGLMDYVDAIWRINAQRRSNGFPAYIRNPDVHAILAVPPSLGVPATRSAFRDRDTILWS